MRVGDGDAVTFTNVDPFPHSVLGANATWGDYAGFKKKSVTYRFSEPGVYPYVCTYHVGMVGVVVVGDGVGGAIDTPTADGPVTKVDASDLALENTSAVDTRPSDAERRVARDRGRCVRDRGRRVGRDRRASAAFVGRAFGGGSVGWIV